MNSKYGKDHITKEMDIESYYHLDTSITYMDYYNVYIGLKFGGGCHEHKVGYKIYDDRSTPEIPYIIVYSHHPKDPCRSLLMRHLIYHNNKKMKGCVLKFKEREVLLKPNNKL